MVTVCNSKNTFYNKRNYFSKQNIPQPDHPNVANCSLFLYFPRALSYIHHFLIAEVKA